MSALDRRRIALATAFTIVAVPALWLFRRDESSDGTGVTTAAAGIASPQAGGPTGDAAGPPATDYVPELPSFLDGPTPAPPPAVIDIAMPAAPTETQPKVIASFRRFDAVAGPRPCTTLLAPSGAVITVTNVDNGLATTCVNRLGGTLPKGVDLVVQTELFSDIADLADAPVPVRLSW